MKRDYTTDPVARAAHFEAKCAELELENAALRGYIKEAQDAQNQWSQAVANRLAN